MNDVVWTPTPEVIERANVTRFMRANGIETYHELVARSTSDIEWFWDAVVKDLEIDFFQPYTQVLDSSDGVEWSRWFKEGLVNLAHQCVDIWAERTPDALAVISESENGRVQNMTYSELRARTNKASAALVSLGVGEGDRVGIFMPMCADIVVAMMACSKIGAVWVPIFSGFGPEAVAARLADSGAKVLIAAETAQRKGAAVAMGKTASQAASAAGCVEHVIYWHSDGDGSVRRPGQLDWQGLLDAQSGEFETLRLDPEHPLFIGYTSGTTGRPKGVVHVHGGFLVKIAEEVAYQADVRPGDVLHWVTDLGWIMGPWEIVGATALGATVLLTEGAPTFPGPDRLWADVAKHGVTVLGVSPTLIRALIPSGEEPVTSHDLSSLRIIASTGEPWNPDPYMWLFNNVGGGRLPIINLSGGTEVGACFLSPLPITALKPCTVRGPALGMDIDVFGPDGKPVAAGEVGELVCKKPWPAMTRGVWGDSERYLDSYWRRWPGVWVHGDWASIDADGYWFLHGRSDDTLSIAGKRIGPAEVESALASHPCVAESAAVGVPDPIKGEAIWCFVVLKPGREAAASELASVVAGHLGGSFKPSRIVFVQELPKTRSAKIVRRAIRAVAVGDDPGDLSSLEDPASLTAIKAALATPTLGR
jgi:acetyl-CoA synthetase